MASVAEKTNDTGTKPTAAVRETAQKQGLSSSPNTGGLSAPAPLAVPPLASNASAVAQRSESEEMEEEETLQGKFNGGVAQRSESEELEEEEPLQAKMQPRGAIPSFGKVVTQAKADASIPAGVRGKMESTMGADFSDVRVHQNSSQASAIGAQAFARGNDVHMAPGKFNPSSQSGQELLGHELAHVVQQREGRVQPTIQAKGVPVNDDAGLEKEADILGAKAARASEPTAAPTQKKSDPTTIGPMQLKSGNVAQREVTEPTVSEPQVEEEEDEEDSMEGEQEAPIPSFPSVSAGEAEQAQSPPTAPPRPAGFDRSMLPKPTAPPRPAGFDRSMLPKPTAPPRPAGFDRSMLPKPTPPPRPAGFDRSMLPKPTAPEQAPALPQRPRMISPKAGISKASGKEHVNYDASGKQDYTEYGILGSGGASAAASATTQGLQYGDTLINKGYDIGTALTGHVPEASQFGETASAVSGLGVAGGALGTIGAVADGVRAGQYMGEKDRITSDRAMTGGGALLSAGGSALKESSTMAFHGATLAKDTVAMGGAAAAAGIGSVAMGAADVVRGTYGAVRADQRATRLRGQAEWTENQDVYSAAKQAESTQEIRKDHAKGTVFKGLLLIGGGAALIIMGANPIGWGLLAGAAIVGGIIALRRFLQKRSRKKDVAIRELGVTSEYQTYKDKKAERKKTTNVWSRRKMAKLESPLDREMTKRGYKPTAYDKFYADYIHDTAWVLYNCGVMGDQQHSVNQEMRNVIINMGLKVDDKKSPLPEVIAKNLHA